MKHRIIGRKDEIVQEIMKGLWGNGEERKQKIQNAGYEYNSIQQKVISSFVVGNSILNAKGIPMCGEYDIKTCIAMLIMDRLDIGGSFAEFHPFDFEIPMAI